MVVRGSSNSGTFISRWPPRGACPPTENGHVKPLDTGRRNDGTFTPQLASEMGVRGARERERLYLEQQSLTREGIYALGEKAVEALTAMLGDPKKGDYVRKDVAFFVIDHIIGKPEHRNQ